MRMEELQKQREVGAFYIQGAARPGGETRFPAKRTPFPDAATPKGRLHIKITVNLYSMLNYPNRFIINVVNSF